MAKIKVGSIVIFSHKVWNTETKRVIDVGEKAIVLEVREPSQYFNDTGHILVVMINENVITVSSNYVKYINFKLQKSEKNLEKIKLRAIERKERRKQIRERSEK
jgi:hypothetical protein